MESKSLEALKHQIRAAFATAPRPDDDCIGYNPDDWESAELAQAFKGKQWQELTPAELEYHSKSFLSHEGFRYYLPAYLLAALDDYGNLLQHTVYGFILTEDPSPKHKELRAWQLKRFNGLAPIEKRAVRAFLEYTRDEYPHYFPRGGKNEPRLALERYWGQQ